MKIERVDDKTVKCFLSNVELEEHEIDYKDFVTRSDKAREMIQEIIEQAAEEVGYKPPKFAFDLQIMMVPEQGMVLTLSEKAPVDLNDKNQMMNYLKELRNLFQGAKNQLDVAAANLKAQQSEQGEQQSNPTAGGANHAVGQEGLSLTRNAASDNVRKKGKNSKQRSNSEQAVFVFAKMRDVLDYAAVLPATLRVKSTLFTMEGKYYLYLQKGSASYERYSRACIQAMEFGSLFTALEDKILYLQEHGECLIPEGALRKLRF